MRTTDLAPGMAIVAAACGAPGAGVTEGESPPTATPTTMAAPVSTGAIVMYAWQWRLRGRDRSSWEMWIGVLSG